MPLRSLTAPRATTSAGYSNRRKALTSLPTASHDPAETGKQQLPSQPLQPPQQQQQAVRHVFQPMSSPVAPRPLLTQSPNSCTVLQWQMMPSHPHSFTYQTRWARTRAALACPCWSCLPTHSCQAVPQSCQCDCAGRCRFNCTDGAGQGCAVTHGPQQQDAGGNEGGHRRHHHCQRLWRICAWHAGPSRGHLRWAPRLSLILARLCYVALLRILQDLSCVRMHTL